MLKDRIGHIMKLAKNCVRNDLKKGKAFIERNWRPREEIAKELAAQKQKELEKAIHAEKVTQAKHKKINLVRQPAQDTCDFHLEEQHGIYFVDGKMGKVHFPR